MRLRTERAQSTRGPARCAAIAAIVAGASTAACSDYRLQVGLTNVPGINHEWTQEDKMHDVISNGDESCPKSGRADADPLYKRIPPCGGAILYFGHHASKPAKKASPPPLAPLVEPAEERSPDEDASGPQPTAPSEP